MKNINTKFKICVCICAFVLMCIIITQKNYSFPDDFLSSAQIDSIEIGSENGNKVFNSKVINDEDAAFILSRISSQSYRHNRLLYKEYLGGEEFITVHYFYALDGEKTSEFFTITESSDNVIISTETFEAADIYSPNQIQGKTLFYEIKEMLPE